MNKLNNTKIDLRPTEKNFAIVSRFLVSRRVNK